MNHKTLAFVTDAWWPQGNGVVNTLMQTRAARAGGQPPSISSS